jgi:hypothetical protein
MASPQLRRAILGLLTVLLAAGAADRAAAQTTLRYKFKKGEKLNYVLEQKAGMSMNFMGQDIQIDFGSTMDMSWDVKDVDADGKAKMVQKFDRIRFTMDGGPTGKIEYDSKDGKEPEGLAGKMMAPMFKALAGAEVSLTLDPQGKATDVKVPEKVIKALKNVPGGGGLGEMFSEDGLKHMFDQVGLVVPKEAISKGKSWNQSAETKTPAGKMKIEVVNTLEEPVKRDGKDLEHVAMKPKISMDPDPDAPIKIALKSQDAKGSAYFDVTAGRLVETNTTQNLEMNVSVAGQEITQKMKTTASLKLVTK